MGLFSTPEQDDEKSDPKPRRAGGKAVLALTILLLSAIVLLPGYLLVTVVSVLIHEERRVRGRWYLIWAGLSLVIGLIAAGGTTGWAGWNLAQVGLVFSRFLPDPTQTPATALTVAAGFAGHLVASVLAQLVASAPLAFLTTAVIVRYRRLAREQRGQIEGPTHSNQRPVGMLDRARNDRERKKIAAGHYLTDWPPAPGDEHDPGTATDAATQEEQQQ
ncbi:hypothetical protein [Gordonia sihwensis]|uniref:hypothetical protein n=1 Tax=Gordonia sihwensis TaxID=173559 RepID=UPI0005F07932|nr:hypothetical protein [Gordonia sihwensis]KJR10236.1 hypothetical protein UG54_01260 [Gordonia sihwensis]